MEGQRKGEKPAAEPFWRWGSENLDPSRHKSWARRLGNIRNLGRNVIQINTVFGGLHAWAMHASFAVEVQLKTPENTVLVGPTSGSTSPDQKAYQFLAQFYGGGQVGSIGAVQNDKTAR